MKIERETKKVSIMKRVVFGEDDEESVVSCECVECRGGGPRLVIAVLSLRRAAFRAHASCLLRPLPLNWWFLGCIEEKFGPDNNLEKRFTMVQVLLWITDDPSFYNHADINKNIVTV